MKFDFDEWMELARKNPNEFERRRQRILKEEELVPFEVQFVVAAEQNAVQLELAKKTK